MQKKEMQEEKRIIIWPQYLDLGLKRSEGRLTAAQFSVRSPKASEISRAAEKLGLKPEVVPDRRHPGSWWDNTGMVTIDNLGPKSVLLRKIGAEMIRMRGGKQ